VRINSFTCAPPIADVGEFVLRLLELGNRSRTSFTRQDQRYFAVTVDFVRARSVGSASAASLVPGLRALTQQ
jgi:hypothetical protein